MAEKLDLITVLDQLAGHLDAVTKQLAGVLIEPANVKGSAGHISLVENHPKGIDGGIV
jgi:hypothetical protein